MNTHNNVSDIIKNIILENNLSQEKLAIILNVSQKTISNWINNNDLPNSNSLLLIYKHFNISPNEILGLENEDYTKTYDYSIEKIKSDLAGASNTSAKLDMKNKIENIAKDKKIPLEKLSNLSEEQINLLLNIIKNFK